VIIRVLDASRYDVVPMAQAREALAQIEGGAKFDVILSDIMMPSMTGVEFYEHLRAIQPQWVRRIAFLSGGVTNPQVGAFLGSIPNRVLSKPFNIGELRSTIDAVASGS
jgi:CheY-like chemotaxis protein